MLSKIVLKNFMCHDNFEIVLNPRVNFVTGQNGSGKSAIVAALMLGLGQRATATNRGHSVKDFIKRGKHCAVLEITLSNTGDNAFEAQTYGGEITVVRRITETSSSYSLRDSQGRVYPTNAAKLGILLMHFNIQPNNPLCILSQDVARTFLQKFEPRSLYTLYSKATLLQVINESLAESKECMMRNDILLERKKEELENLEKEVEMAEKRKKLAERYQMLTELELEVKNELIWSQMKFLETEVEKKQRKQTEIDEERHKLVQKIRNSSEDVLKAKLKELQEELARSKEKLKNTEIQQNKEKETLSNVEEESLTLKQNSEEIERQIQRKERDLKRLQEESEKVLNVNAPELQKQKKELQCLVVKIQELEAARKTTEVHLNQLKDTCENNTPQLERIDADIRRASNKASESRARIELFKKGKSLAVYGQWMPRVVEEINKAASRGMFTQRPKGPVGSHLQVIDSRWAPAIEYLLKGHLPVFLLNSDADLSVYNKIVEKFVPRNSIPPVSISKFLSEVHDFSRLEVQHSRFTSLVRQLKCSDADILNYLIDEANIEQILLVPDLNNTFALCEETINVPKNLNFCVTLQGDSVHPAPNYKFFAGRMRSQTASFLQVNPAEHLASLEKAHAESQEELVVLQSQRKSVKEESISVLNDAKKTQQSLDSLWKQLKALNLKKLEMEMNINFEPVSVDLYKKDIELIVSKKEEALQEKEGIVGRIEKNEIKINEIKDKLKNISEVWQTFYDEKEKILQLIHSTEKDIRDKEKLGAKLKTVFQSLLSKEKALQEELLKMRGELQEKRAEVENSASECETIRDLPEVEEHLKEIKVELRGLKNICEEKTIEIAEQDLADKKSLLKKSSRFMNSILRMTDTSKNQLEKDIKLMEQSERRQLSVARNLFSEVLKQRDLQGTFNVDHNAETLRMSVVRGKEKGAGKKGEISSLSGGEKSFATIAFIIAVWNSMTVPFFVMDEFDVFTDVITRNTILKMLLEYATQNSAQFIFLTPHDLSRIDTKLAEVTVHRINSPRNN